MAEVKRLLEAVASLWAKQIKLCEDRKRRDFGDTARQVWEFVGQRYNRTVVEQMFFGFPRKEPGDDMLAVANFTALFVDTMKAHAFARVPDRLVDSFRPQIPPELEALFPDAVNMQHQSRLRDSMVSWLTQWFLRWSPRSYNLKKEGEQTVCEALGKGCGVSWVQIVDGPTGEIPATLTGSIDDLFIDSDCRRISDAGFIFRRWELPCYRIAEITGEPLKNLRGSGQSSLQQSVASMRTDQRDSQKDIAVFYEFWSRIGLGEKLIDAGEDFQDSGEFAEALAAVGQYVHFYLMRGVSHPLGLDPETLLAEAGIVKKNALNDRLTAKAPQQEFTEQLTAILIDRLKWPIPTYCCQSNPFPMRMLGFKADQTHPWYRSLLEPALPIQRAIDRIYMSLMNRAKAAGRDILLHSTEIEEQILDALQSCQDLPMIPVNGAVTKETMDKLLHIVSFPQMNKDLPMILKVLEQAFREMTGLDPAWTTGGIPRTQDRSATATSSRQGALSRRPDDIADAVEAWMSESAELEAIAARLLVKPQTIAPLFNETLTDNAGEPAQPDTDPQQINYSAAPLTAAWMQFVHTNDPAIAAAEMEYTVEAGSGRRKNRQLMQQNAQQMFSMFGNQAFTIGMEVGNIKAYTVLCRQVASQFDMQMEPYMDALNETMQQLVAMRQQQAAPPGQGGPGGTPAQAGVKMPGGESLNRRYMTASGGPPNLARLPAPPQGEM